MELMQLSSAITSRASRFATMLDNGAYLQRTHFPSSNLPPDLVQHAVSIVKHPRFGTDSLPWSCFWSRW